MCMYGSEAVITNNTIVRNFADDVGGILIFDALPTIANNVIARNSGLLAGGIMNFMANASIINNTIVHNRPNAMYLGETMWLPWVSEGGQPVLNNIIWQNEIYMSEFVLPSEYDIRFNNIQGGWLDEGNIDTDPLFADPANGDYHLKSQVGRWDPTSGSWVQDDVTSGCIDAGDPAWPVGDEPEPNGQRINMGAFGGTPQASMSLPTVVQE